MCVIYKLTCKTSSKSYVGQTKHTSKYRWNQHVWEARNPQANQSRKLNNAILKYGIDDWIIEDLWTCDEDEVDIWECHFIESHGTFLNGYNLTAGGKKNQVVSEETREKLSNALKGKPKNVKNNHKRSEDNWLPKYVKHYIDSTCEGYRVSDHPRLKRNNTITFARSNQTMEEKFMLAIQVLDALDNDTYVPKIKGTGHVGVLLIPNGYRVRIKGRPAKTFQKKINQWKKNWQWPYNMLKVLNRGERLND